MSEYIFKKLLKINGLEHKYYVSSAGTSSEEAGNDMYWGAKDKLDEKNIPYSKHKARQLKQEDYKKYDYIIGMETYNIMNIIRIIGEDKESKVYRLLDFTDNPRDIDDPWYTGNFEVAYNDILEGCKGLLKHLEENQ